MHILLIGSVPRRRARYIFWLPGLLIAVAILIALAVASSVVPFNEFDLLVP